MSERLWNALPVVLKAEEVAHAFGVSRQAVYRLIAKHDLPVLFNRSKGHAIRVSKFHLRSWLAQR